MRAFALLSLLFAFSARADEWKPLVPHALDDNVVYSTHVYPNKGTDWDNIFGDLSESVPVFAGELGGTESPDQLNYVSRLLEYLDQREIGFAAWSWCNEPYLVTRYTPTRFGQLVQQSLAGPR